MSQFERIIVREMVPIMMPTLFCPSGSSSECSSSEDSATRERSPTPPDGYEADVENGRQEATSVKSRKISSSLSMLSNVSDEHLMSQEVISMECPEYKSELAHPELCVIVVDIISQLIDKLLKEEENTENVEKEIVNEGGVYATKDGGLKEQCSAGAAEVARVCGGLARAWGARGSGAPGGSAGGALRRLLAPGAPASRLLEQRRHKFSELQRGILDLVEAVAAHGVSPGEAAAVLRPLAAPDPPLTLLLPALHRLTARAAEDRHAPDSLLTFPIHPDPEELFLEDSVGASFRQQAEINARKIRHEHLRVGEWSSWAASAARAVAAAGWAPWLQGFALALWLRLVPAHGEQTPRRAELPADLLHVLSVGHDSLMFELWVNPSNGEVTVRLTRPDSSGYKIVSGARGLARVPGGTWACLAVNVNERVHRKRIHIQVTLFINGRECETLSLPLQGILVRKSSPTTLLLGQAGRGPGAGPGGGGLQLSSVRVWRSGLLRAGGALHVAAHPPDLPCQIPCESAHFPSILSPELIEMDIDWDSVYEVSSSTLRELHDGLLLTFSAHAPDTMQLYHTPPAAPTAWGGRAAGACGGEAGAVRVWWAGCPRPTRRRGLPTALLALGGTELLLYLFARVVELSATGPQQAVALSVTLRACAADARLHAALLHDMLPLLQPVLAAPAARVTHHMLKVILDEACSSPVLVSSGSAGSDVTLLAENDSVLLEPRYLVLLMRAWKCFDTDEEVVWEVPGGGRERGSCWALALAALGRLLHARHPRRAFNHYQASRLDVLRHLLTACKERFLNTSRGSLCATGSASLVVAVRALLGVAGAGGPAPGLSSLALLADFLLLMHQASDTFVTHSRANFYFLLTAETPETSDFNFLNFMGKRKQPLNVSDNKRYYDTIEKSSSSSISNEDVTNENHLNDVRELAENRESDHESSVESTKQMKGLVNAQIKQNRQTLSSTSENSDTTEKIIGERDTGDVTGGAKEGVDRKEDAEVLDGFIVVDEDEAGPPSVDLYTGGLYEQRRLLAGAEPGWRACGGLLLLLRDSLRALSDHQLAQAVSTAVPPETLVVLANHSAAGVRAAVVRVLCALQRPRAPPLPPHTYTHLANQISLYPASRDLASACAELLTNRDVPLEEQLDEEAWSWSEEACGRSPPLLALLPQVTRAAAVPLAHTILSLLRRLVDRSSLKALSEVAVVEVIANSIRNIGLEENNFEGRELLLEDLYDLLCRLAIKVLAGNHSMQIIIDMHHMLRYIECECGRQGAGEGGAGGVQAAVRHAQTALYLAQLDYLELRLREQQQQPKATNYFANVLEGSRADGDVGSRLAGVASRAVTFLTGRATHHALPPDALLLDRLLAVLLAVCGGEAAGGAARLWGGGAGGECGGALAELFWWAASPAPAARPLQTHLLRALYHAPTAALRLLAPKYKDPSALRKLSVYLLTLVQHVHLTAERGGEAVEPAITDWARDWAVGSQAELAERVRGPALLQEAERLLRADRTRRARHAASPRLRAAIGKAVFSREATARALADSAMAATRQVVEIQDGERKAFLEHLCRADAQHAASLARWHTIIDTHTHERGVWHSPMGYPSAWQLDSTEGPGRVRMRLRRAHLRIPSRFLKPEHRHKAESAAHAPPLRGVLGAGARGGLAARLQPGETVAHTARVLRVTVAHETPGELLLTDRCLHFVAEGEADEAGGGWSLGSLRRVATRRWCLQERALELFLRCGRALLLAFADTEQRTVFLRHLERAHRQPLGDRDRLADALQQWRTGAITNWEYLMILNGLAGRSYNDLMQYPVLPFIIADYASKILDLTDPTSFRDLEKPMAVQNKNREQHYINTFNDLKTARREGCSPLVARQAHHYASLYSNSGGVLHYLVRLPPFTELFINYQDNNFDMPDRTFHSLATTWRLITQDSPTDVKELIPELFYLPELFYNTEGLALGVRQCGAKVDDVELPQWAADARLFTLVHRQALEAPLVTERLPLWIDLVFGHKQTGQAAVDAINVFPACTYYGFDPSSLEDELDRTAAAAMVRTYGQAPRQLFRAPHPQRASELLPRQIEVGVWAGVVGARWGRFCGSPELAPPSPVARRSLPGAVRLQRLAQARAVVACQKSTMLMIDNDEPSSAATEVPCAVSWAHADGAVRVRRRRDAPAATLLHVLSPESVEAAAGCAEAGGAGGGWGAAAALGLSSGRVLVLRAAPRAHRALHAHDAPVADLALCPRAGLLVTASVDGVIVLWDLNDLTYIRTLPNRDMLPVRHVAVSETLSDVATVHEPPAPGASGVDDNEYERDTSQKYKSLIRVHTVNARFVGSVRVAEPVTCVCYSHAPEGVSVNVIAAGLGSGGVRMYSSWDLRPLVFLPPARPHPLVSLTFSCDSQLLFSCHADGTVLAWESAEAGARAAAVSLLPAHALL